MTKKFEQPKSSQANISGDHSTTSLSPQRVNMKRFNLSLAIASLLFLTVTASIPSALAQAQTLYQVIMHIVAAGDHISIYYETDSPDGELGAQLAACEQYVQSPLSKGGPGSHCFIRMQ